MHRQNMKLAGLLLARIVFLNAFRKFGRFDFEDTAAHPLGGASVDRLEMRVLARGPTSGLANGEG